MSIETLIDRDTSVHDEALADIVERSVSVRIPDFGATPKEKLRAAVALAFPEMPAIEVDCILGAAPAGTPTVIAFARVLQALVYYYFEKDRPREWRATRQSRAEAIAHLKREIAHVEAEEGSQ